MKLDEVMHDRQPEADVATIRAAGPKPPRSRVVIVSPSSSSLRRTGACSAATRSYCVGISPVDREAAEGRGHRQPGFARGDCPALDEEPGFVRIVGAPDGIGHTLTVGHISRRHKPNTVYSGFVLAEYLQTDAAINQGNSGGRRARLRRHVEPSGQGWRATS